MSKNTQNGWTVVKNFFGIGPKTKTTKTSTTFTVSTSDSEALSEISKTISTAPKDMLEQALLESTAFFQECTEEFRKCDFIGDSVSEEQQ